MDILSNVSVSGELTAKNLYAENIVYAENVESNILVLHNGGSDSKAIIICGERAIDFNDGAINFNNGEGGVRICGNSLAFKSTNGFYPVYLRSTEYYDEGIHHLYACSGAFDFNGCVNVYNGGLYVDGEFFVNSSLCVNGPLCVGGSLYVTGEAHFRNGIVTSSIVVENSDLVHSMTKSITIPANCSKFHIVTGADNFGNPLPYLATMSNGDGFNKNVNVDYLFNMCNLIGIVTPSGESRSMTFTILK